MIRPHYGCLCSLAVFFTAFAPSLSFAAGPASAPASGPAIEEIPGDTVLVKLGDDSVITQRDFEQFARGAKPDRYARLFVNLVQQRQLLIYGKAHPDLVSDEEVDKMLTEAMKKGQSMQQIQDRLAKQGLTLASWRERRRGELIRAAIARRGASDATTPEARKKMFDEEPQAFNGAQVLARHLMVTVPAYLTPEEQDKLRKKIEDIRERLVSGKIDWDKAQQESGASLQANGELGWISRHTDVNEAVAAAAFQIRPNETSKVVRSGLGFHIVQVMERREGVRRLEDPETERDIKIWAEMDAVYKVLAEMDKMYPVVGVRAPARTTRMATSEFNRPPPLVFGMPTPASKPAKSAATKPAGHK